LSPDAGVQPTSRYDQVLGFATEVILEAFLLEQADFLPWTGMEYRNFFHFDRATPPGQASHLNYIMFSAAYSLS
jgi:hypothetical protein